MTKLTPEIFDGLARAPAREDRIIWTLKAIGQRMGRGREFAALLARQPGTPIRRQGRQHYVIEQELLAYLKSPPQL